MLGVLVAAAFSAYLFAHGMRQDPRQGASVVSGFLGLVVSLVAFVMMLA
jgi:hypothetical protein